MQRDLEGATPQPASPSQTAPTVQANNMVSFQDQPPTAGPASGYVRLGRESRAVLEHEPHGEAGNGCFTSLCEDSSRIVSRSNGRTNVQYSGLKLKWFGFLTDSFTTLINTRWYIVGLVFGGTYVLSWLVFAGIWAAIAKYEHVSYDDLDDINDTCLHGVDDFASSLLFSIETQVTIGYGNTFITNNCYGGLIVLILQCVVGLVLDAVLLGLLFTKITRPRNRRKTIAFSDKAVLYEEDGDHYLEFRIGNLRKSQIAEAHVRMVLYWYRDMGRGESEFQQHELQCGYETGVDRVVLLTPVAVRHKIDRDSPLYDLVPSHVLTEQLEVVVVLEGIVEATGLTVQALWSYTNEEIVLGEKLRPIVQRERGKWVVDFSRFDEIILA